MPTSLSIIVPAYNEADRLGNSLGAIVTYLCDNFPELELIVVDDGSSDKTAKSPANAWTLAPISARL